MDYLCCNSKKEEVLKIVAFPHLLRCVGPIATADQFSGIFFLYTVSTSIARSLLLSSTYELVGVLVAVVELLIW